MNLSPFDTNMKCSSKYMSPINIDMKTSLLQSKMVIDLLFNYNYRCQFIVISCLN